MYPIQVTVIVRIFRGWKFIEARWFSKWHISSIMHVISLCLLFSPEFLRECIAQVDVAGLPLKDGESVQDMCDKLFPVIFDPKVMSNV